MSDRAKMYRKKYLAACLLLGEIVASDNYEQKLDQIQELELIEEEWEA